MCPERLRRNHANLLRPAQSRHTVAFIFAHDAKHLRHGIGALIVHFRFNRIDEVLLFALNILRAEHAVFRQRTEQDFLRQIHDGSKNTLSLRQKCVLNKISVKTHQLDLALAADQRTEACSVERIQLHGNAADVRIMLRRTKQNTRKQCIKRSIGCRVRTKKVQAEAGSFKFFGLHRTQSNPGCNRDCFYHLTHPFISSIIH